MIEQNSCWQCMFFVSEPDKLEQAVPGLNILSSAYGSVRADTGLCNVSQRFVTPIAACTAFKNKNQQGGLISSFYW